MLKQNNVSAEIQEYRETAQSAKEERLKETQPLSGREIEFAVFCIENVALELQLYGEEVYRMLAEKSHILDEYIISNYEILHTQSREYIVRDIIDCMREQGVIK